MAQVILHETVRDREQVERKFGTQGGYLVDFVHLSQCLSRASEKSSGDEAKSWLHALKQGQLEKVITELKKCGETADEKGVI